MAFAENYLEMLRERGKKSKVYREFQLTGLTVADLLGDRKHKALYIRLAKLRGKDEMLALAKRVADLRDVKNKGAYFMSVLHAENGAVKTAAPEKKRTSAKKKTENDGERTHSDGGKKRKRTVLADAGETV